jgi:hypothetical protein
MSEVPLFFVQVTVGVGRPTPEHLIATADRRFRLRTTDPGEAEHFMAFLRRRGYQEPRRPEDNFPDLPGFGFDIYGGEIYEDGEVRHGEFERPRPEEKN